MNKDARITGILARYEEDLSSTWLVQGQRVIYHSALERIAARAGIRFDKPDIIRAQDREAVIMVCGHMDMGERFEWSIGEANMDLNYRTSGKQQAYPYAMAEKRAKDRVILKLIELHGLLYSEEEADDFKRPSGWGSDGPVPKPGDKLKMPDGSIAEVLSTGSSCAEERREIMSDAISSGKPVQLDDGEVHPGEALRRCISEYNTSIGLKNFMLRHEVQTYLSGIPEDQRNELREYALSRMADLGWKKGGRPNG